MVAQQAAKLLQMHRMMRFLNMSSQTSCDPMIKNCYDIKPSAAKENKKKINIKKKGIHYGK